VVRVTYEPHLHKDSDQNETVAFEEVPIEVVQWEDFRMGPEKSWRKQPWIAFKRYMSRTEIEDLMDPAEDDTLELGTDDFRAAVERMRHALQNISFDQNPSGSNIGADKTLNGVVGKAEVWEIWDKEARLVWFYAPSYKDGMITVEQDPFEFADFYPCPKPIVHSYALDGSAPLVPYEYYKAQAEALETTSERIATLTTCLKWRGIRAAEIEELEELPSKEDGEFIPSQGALSVLAAGGKLSDAIWTMPLDELIVVVRELVAIREQQKQVIYELTGIADIMRGSSNAKETLGAQKIKQTWGSLRVKRFQGEIQRFIRDIFRLQAHLIANVFSEDTLTVLNGKPVDPQVIKALKDDFMNRMRVDVETDSTVRGDLDRIQTEQTNFLAATGQFIGAIGPVIKSPSNPDGFLPPEIAISIFQSFARSYRLGREVENILDGLASQAAKAKEEEQPDPMEEAMKKAAADDAQAQAVLTAAEGDKVKAETQLIVKELGAEPDQSGELKDQAAADEAQTKLEGDFALKDRELNMKEDAQAHDQADTDKKRRHDQIIAEGQLAVQVDDSETKRKVANKPAPKPAAPARKT
jgi:hypothetical protein